MVAGKSVREKGGGRTGPGYVEAIWWPDGVCTLLRPSPQAVTWPSHPIVLAHLGCCCLMACHPTDCLSSPVMPLDMHTPSDCYNSCTPLGCYALPLITQVMFFLQDGERNREYIVAHLKTINCSKLAHPRVQDMAY